MFDRIAPRYDLLNRLLSGGTDVRWRRRAVDLLDLRAPSRVLDLCTGTADLLVEALGRDPRHSGLGVDLSHGMLVRGAAKLRRAGLADRAALVGGDGERLPVREGSFDGALVAFGIRNVGDPARAVREVVRVLRPGGRFVVLEFSMPRGVLGAAYRLYFRSVLPRLGGLVSGDGSAYAYLPASVERFPAPREFGALLEVTWRLLTGGIACLHRGEKPR
jgi:demethylmenaquinone methyltransferase/2-methoxy-6-polyprenyl-1,4-benzoquinol methylase